jgi:hypothetical protein
MHFNFHFTAVEVLWTLTFAALLVLLVVLLGRDRARRYPWFTAAMVMMALRLLASRLLFGRLPHVVSTEVFLGMADLAAILSLLVVVELARRAFAGASRTAASRTTSMVWTLILLAVSGTVLALWGPWPSWKTLFAGSELSAMRLMQLFAQKAELLADLLLIELGIVIALFGRRFNAGWRSHTQQIAIGFSTASIAQLATHTIWQEIVLHTTIRSQDVYTRVIGLQDKLYNANSAIFLAVLVWWIVCLWIDEPGAPKPAEGDEQATCAGEEPANLENTEAQEATEARAEAKGAARPEETRSSPD